MSPRSRQTLKQEGLLRSYTRHPQEAIRVLAQRYRTEPTEARRQALAEMSSDTGDRHTESDPAVALGYYLEAAFLTKDHLDPGSGRSDASEDLILHDYATVRMVRVLHANPSLVDQVIVLPGSSRRYELKLATGREFVSPKQFDQLVPASWLKFKGMDFESVTQQGIGEAMVGHRDATAEARAADPLMPIFGHSSPLNASLRFSGTTATIALQDLMISGRTKRNGQTVPLKGDFTAALASLYSDRRAQGYKYLATLRPWKYRHATGLYSLEPFRKEKIPLIVVHGLLSSGGSFFEFANKLRADPVMRERYQLILFTYPTGISIGLMSAELRGALDAHHKFYDPRGSYPAFNKAVIIGHSMGGILSNAQIRSSGDQIEKLFLKQPLENLDADEASKQGIAQLLRFEANPRIQRAVFIAVPHRGSDMTTTTLGQLGSWLIRLPFDLVDEIFESVLQPDDLTREGRALSDTPRNSINSLRPDNPVLPAILELPVRKGVVMHSIIAQKNPGQPLEESSDGVVPYRSSHLEEAATEKIITNADHKNVVNDPRCVEEILRILREHAGS